MGQTDIIKMASEPFSMIMLRMPPTLIGLIDDQAKSELTNRSAWIRSAILAMLNQRNRQSKVAA